MDLQTLNQISSSIRNPTVKLNSLEVNRKYLIHHIKAVNSKKLSGKRCILIQLEHVSVFMPRRVADFITDEVSFVFLIILKNILIILFSLFL